LTSHLLNEYDDDDSRSKKLAPPCTGTSVAATFKQLLGLGHRSSQPFTVSLSVSLNTDYCIITAVATQQFMRSRYLCPINL